MIKCSEEEKLDKNKIDPSFEGKGELGFSFCTQDTIEGVSDLGSIAVLLKGAKS